MAQCYGLWSKAILISDTPRRVVPLPSCFCRCMRHLMVVTGTKLHHFLICATWYSKSVLLEHLSQLRNLDGQFSRYQINLSLLKEPVRQNT